MTETLFRNDMDPNFYSRTTHLSDEDILSVISKCAPVQLAESGNLNESHDMSGVHPLP